VRLLDRWFSRRPFEGAAAARYAGVERPAFGGLDGRVLAALAGDLAGARVLLDVGAGNGEFARRAATRAGLAVLALEPSRDYTRAPWPGVTLLRGAAEALPLAAASVDVALCLTSLRHVRDRRAALRELGRVLRPGAPAWIVELDRDATRARVEHHTAAMSSRLSRAAFRLAVLPACPPARDFIALAEAAGFAAGAARPDDEQPFFLLRLTARTGS